MGNRYDPELGQELFGDSTCADESLDISASDFSDMANAPDVVRETLKRKGPVYGIDPTLGKVVCMSEVVTEKEQQAVVAYIRRYDGKMLAIFDHRGYSAPGGKIEPNETKAQALRRELKEEVGIAIFGWRLAYGGLHESGRRVFVYLVEEDETEGAPTALEPGTRVEWVDPEVIASGFASGFHRKAMVELGILPK